MKLVHIVLPENKPPELRLARSFSLVGPQIIDAVLGWRMLVRGPAVILLSPDGPGHEFARSSCVLTWDSANTVDYDKIGNYTSDVLERNPVAKKATEAKP